MLRKEIPFAKLRASDFGLSQLNDAQRGEVTGMSAVGGKADIDFGRVHVCL